MASVVERKLKNGSSSWIVHVRVKGEKAVSKTFETRSLAEEFGLKTEALLMEQLRAPGQALSSKSFYQERFKHAIALFLAHEATPEHHRFTLKPVMKHFPDCLIGELRPSHVATYVKKMMELYSRMGRSYKPNTIATHLASMSAVFKWRAKEYDIDAKTNVFSRSQLPKGWDTQRDRRLAPDEERRLMQILRKKGSSHYRWRLLIKLALETAARQGELFLAEWSEFNFQTRCWSIPKQHTKTKVARMVPLSKRAMRILKALKRLSPPGEERPFESLVSAGNIRCAFRQYLKAAGVVDFRFHDLRHEAVSRMVLNKRQLSVFEIMKIVGHSSTQMLNRYANLRGEELVNRME